MAYNDPRPYWVEKPTGEPKVQAFNCTYGYGNPSNHSSYSTAIALAVVLDLVHSNNKIVLKLLAVFTPFIFSSTIAYSRLFLGEHALD